MKLKDWKIPYARPSISPSLASAGFTPLLSAVLALRGISSAEEAKALIYGDGAWLLDPMLIKGMGAAVQRITAVLREKNRVEAERRRRTEKRPHVRRVRNVFKNRDPSCARAYLFGREKRLSSHPA